MHAVHCDKFLRSCDASKVRIENWPTEFIRLTGGLYVIKATITVDLSFQEEEGSHRAPATSLQNDQSKTTGTLDIVLLDC